MAGILFGADRDQLKQRMERIIAAEDETVKTMKKLIEAISQHRQVMEKLLAKL